MIRFFGRILLIATFFIGLGAISDAFVNSFSCKKLEPESKIIRIERIDGLSVNIAVDKPFQEKKIIIFQQNY